MSTDLVPSPRETAPCGCPIRALEYLDGQHLWYCTHNGDPYGMDTARFRVGHLDPHNVDGVVMPWAGPGWAYLSRRWCDISELGDGAHIARRFDATNHFAMAGRLHGGWHWTIFDTATADQDPPIVAQGDAGDVAEVLEAVYKAETTYELAA